MAESKVNVLEGNERADYARTHLPEGRWKDTWDLLKTNFFKIVIINVLTLIFLLPAITLILYFKAAYMEYLGATWPFAANVGVATLIPFKPGMAEELVFNADLTFYAMLIATGVIASAGIAGAAYSLRQLINTHGKFSFKDYFHGIKVCYFRTLLPVTAFLALLFAAVVVSDWAALVAAQGGNAAGPVALQVITVIAAVLGGIYCCWVLAVGVSYKIKLGLVLKSSFKLMLSTFIQTVFILAFALLPLWILLIPVDFFAVIGYAIFLVFGFSFVILCWMAFAQWVFDAVTQPAVKTEKEAARTNMTARQLAAEKQAEEKASTLELLAAGKSELISTPMKPIGGGISVSEISTAFTRGDISRAQSQRSKLEAEVKEYYEAHKNEARYAEYNAMFAEREKVLQVKDKKSRKKKISSDNLLK